MKDDDRCEEEEEVKRENKSNKTREKNLGENRYLCLEREGKSDQWERCNGERNNATERN